MTRDGWERKKQLTALRKRGDALTAELCALVVEKPELAETIDAYLAACEERVAKAIKARFGDTNE